MGGMTGGTAGAPMGSGGAVSATQPALPMSAASGSLDLLEQYRQPGAAVPLGELADVRVVTGPPMIKDENGVLVGYVFADIDQTERDLGGWVDEAKALVAAQLNLPAGYRLQWTGQYEFLAAMEARLRYIVPLTLLLVAGTVVMLGSVPLGGLVGDVALEAQGFLMAYVNGAGQRALIIGATLGVLATGLRIVLGLERSYLSE